MLIPYVKSRPDTVFNLENLGSVKTSWRKCFQPDRVLTCLICLSGLDKIVKVAGKTTDQQQKLQDDLYRKLCPSLHTEFELLPSG